MAEVLSSSATIVLVGRMNPLIFQPEWMREQKLIGEAEADHARNGGIELIHHDIASINLKTMKVVVDVERFTVTATEEPLVQVRDFAAGCLALLSHTPSIALGMNHTVHVRAESEEKWHRFGDKLGPKGVWSALLGDDVSDHTGGLRGLTMERSKRPDGRPGYIRVIVDAVEGNQPDTKFQFNDHYQLGGGEKTVPAAEAVRIIAREWENSFAAAQKVFNQLKAELDGV